MSGHERCENCGAPMTGRDCDYCSPTSGRALDPNVLAQTIAGADGDIESAIKNIAERLRASFPDHTEVDTALFGGKIKLLEVKLEPHVYRVRRDGKHLVPERSKVVRGVALKTVGMDFAEWVKELSADLAAMAKETAKSRAALARWVRGE